MGTNLSVFGITSAVTTISKMLWTIPIIDKSQFLNAISVMDKFSPITFFDKYSGKCSMCLTKFFSCKSNHKSVFLDVSRKGSSSRTLPWD